MYQTNDYEGMLAETVMVPGRDGELINAYLARPLGPGPYPGMVLIHHAPGWDELYRELGVNPVISSYGQIGAYEDVYKSYKNGGFTYRLDSLRRLGVSNIVLKQGEWHPERHPDYKYVYEVTYP